ncbi:hypothetical protein HYH02_004025 [Chlamydomonas schloesseri]|uniref:Uncharacterized protein n=1 Tax=Chlamydomonas schloesseri TaxID=2026947 RepID=A0A835WR90_9CHLO|nr:hypothetical protein HYH02_004025 [Chlamydomonas schloesseri]|eukprot:KAG2451426.1 hypothetical protein HYH02_004025 [Chlamydomonas schloesseri]
MPATVADPTKREISGFFLSQEKFGAHLAALASPACGTASLRLFHNEPQHTAAVLQALRDNTSVTSLDIFELDPASADMLASLLSNNARLTSLAIHHAHGADAAARLAAGLAANAGLTQLHFSQLDARGVTAIANAIGAWANSAAGAGAARLQHLRLDKSLLNAEAAAALAAALGPQAAALARLEVVESDMGGGAAATLLGSPAWAALTAALTELDLSGCHLGPQAGELLGCFLATPGCRLAALALPNNRLLGPSGAAALAAGLAANASLRRLDLANCGVTAPGVVALAAALRPEAGAGGAAAPPPLQHLCLNDNAAGAEGLLALLCAMSPFPLPQALPQQQPGLLLPCGLRTLHLDANQVRGADLAEALGVAAPPKILAPAAAAVHQQAVAMAAAARDARAAATAAAASAASAEDAGAAAAAAAARRFVHVTGPLEQLSLGGNALYDVGTTALAAALGGAPALESLDLRENGISDAGVAALLPLVGGGGADGRRVLGGASRRGSAGGGGSCGAAGGGASAAAGGLQGLVLDGNRIHNAGGQALLEAVTAAPGLWRFSAEANKLTDPALRLSLTQLSQLRAARHSQLVVLGRQYSSSSSSSGEDPEGGQNGGRRSGGGGGGADSARRGSGGGGGGGGGSHRSSMEEEDRPPQHQNGGGHGHGHVAANAMDLDGPQQQDHQHQHQHHQHKHRLDDEANGHNGDGDGGSSSGDERRPSGGGRNVAARAGLNGGPHDIHVSAGAQATAAAAAAMLAATAAAADRGAAGYGAGLAPMDVTGNGNGCDTTQTGAVRCHLQAMAVGSPHLPCGDGGGLGGGCGGAHPMAIDSQPCMPSSSAGCGAGLGGAARPPSVGGVSSRDSSLFGSYDPPSHMEAHGCFRSSSSSGVAAAAGSMPPRSGNAGAGGRFGSSSGGGGGGLLATSPPPAMCYVNAMTGVGGAGSVGVSKQAAVAGGGGHGGHGAGGGHDFTSTPQQILPACRRPRYKPLTPEQQRMFEDF